MTNDDVYQLTVYDNPYVKFISAYKIFLKIFKKK